MSARGCYYPPVTHRLALLGLVVATVLALSATTAAGAGQCGGDGERPCTIAPASFAGKKPAQCPAGAFFDPIDGGTCWRCPQGYGASGQRPCLLGERNPLCNANLKENFKRNVCEPLRPGESPFFGGLASLASVYGDALRGLCRETLGAIDVPSHTQLAMGANCSKNVFVGAACDWLAEQSGAGVASAANTVLSAGPAATQFKQQVDRAYASAPCSGYAEKLAPATRHGRGGGAIGTDCQPGQFWDPNGSCYSCPRSYTRTLNPVDSPGACVDKLGGEIAHSTCSVFVAAERTFGDGAKCAVEVMQSGVFVTQPLGSSRRRASTAWRPASSPTGSTASSPRSTRRRSRRKSS